MPGLTLSKTVATLLACTTTLGCVKPATTPRPAEFIIEPVYWSDSERDELKNNEYYVSLKSISEKTVISSNQCIDQGLLDYFRKILYKNATEVFAIITFENSGLSEIKAPIYSFAIDETKQANEANKCHSYTYSASLSPWNVATPNATQTIKLEFGHKKKFDFKASENLSSLSEGMKILSIGTNGFMVKQLASQGFKNVSESLRKSVEDNVSISTQDTKIEQLSVIPGKGNIKALRIKLPQVNNAATGSSLDSEKYASFTIGLETMKSHFIANDTPTPYYKVISTQLARTEIPDHGTLLELLRKGIEGVTPSNLENISTFKQAELACKNLEQGLGKAFTNTDVTIAKYSILNSFAPQTLTNPKFANEICINASDRKTLEKYPNYFPLQDPTRMNDERRDKDVTRIIGPVLQAIKSGDEKSIRSFLSNENKALRTRDLSGINWGNESLDMSIKDPVSRLAKFGKGISYGCYQASPIASLAQIGTVLNIRGQRLGAILYFGPNGEFEQITLDSIEEIRNMGALGEDYASAECNI